MFRKLVLLIWLFTINFSFTFFNAQKLLDISVGKQKKQMNLYKIHGFIEPKTHVISFYLSDNQYPLIVKDPSILLDSEIKQKMGEGQYKYVDALFVNYQYNFSKRNFIETSFKYFKHWTYFKTNKWVVNMFDYQSSFSVLSFSFGTGYRFIGENNLRFFDVHAGLTLGITDNPVGNGQIFSNSFYYQDGNGVVGLFSYAWQMEITSRYCIGFYLGLSKDLRIKDNLFASFRYHYQLGKESELSNYLIYYDIPTLGITETVKASNTAKGQMFALGLRWIFETRE